MRVINILSEHKKPNHKHPVPVGFRRVMAVVEHGGQKFTAHLDIKGDQIKWRNAYYGKTKANKA